MALPLSPATDGEAGVRPGRVGVWLWVCAMLTLGGSMSMLVSDELVRALVALDVELPLLTQLGMRFGEAMHRLPVIASWVAVVAVTGLPGFVVRDRRLGRLYAVGAGAALLLMFAMAASLQLDMGRVLAAMSTAESPAAGAAPRDAR